MTSLRPLEPNFAELALSNCNECAATREENIAALQTWIRKSPHLKACTDERLLLAFLRRSKFSLEESKKRIDAYYSLKNVFPEVLKERAVSDALLKLFKEGIHCIPLKPIDSTGPRIIISQYCKINPKIQHPREAFKLLFMLLEIMAMEDDNTSISGVAYVVDARDVNMEQMLQYDPYLLKKTFLLLQHGIPLHFAEIHLINMRKEGQAIFNFVTSFLPAKMPFKFIVHKKAEDMYTHLPREAMSIEYGGSNGYHAEALAYWQQKLQQYSSHFEQDAGYGTNEQLRVGLTQNWQSENAELLGTNGSFRKLEVD